MSEPIMPGAEGDTAEFSAIINDDAELAILGTPTPPWEHANDDPSAMIECATKLTEASEKDALFVPTLDQLYLDFRTGQLNYGFMTLEYQQSACIRDAAWLVRNVPHPDIALAWFEAREAPSFRAEDDAHVRAFIDRARANPTGSPTSIDDQLLAEAQGYLDPERRKAAQEHVLSVVYGERYMAYKKTKQE